MSTLQKPRNLAGPIVRGTDLWGRQTEIRELTSLLDRGSVLITAPRRHGKSSLMSAVGEALISTWAVVQMDVEYLETPEEWLTEVTASLLQLERFRAFLMKAVGVPRYLANWLSGIVESVGGTIPGFGELKINLRQTLPSSGTWVELTEQLFDALRAVGGRLLLIIDEFPMMVTNQLERDRDVAVRFLSWFRAQRQRADMNHVRFLLGGSVNIEPTLEALGHSALLNDLQRFHLKPMPTVERLLFVTALLDEEGCKYEPNVPQRIVDTADCGVHFFLQVLVAECIAHARQNPGPLAPGNIEPIYRARVLGPPNRARFSHYHTRLREHYGTNESAARVILSALASARASSESALSDLLRHAGEDPTILRPVLTLLEADYYIVRDGNAVSFSSGFLRDWWLRNEP